MTADKVPAPIIPAQPITATIRQAYEECANNLDATPSARALELQPVVLPSGDVATVRCARDKRGGVRITIAVARAIVAAGAK